MLKYYIRTVIVFWILSFLVNGFCLYTIALAVPVLLYCGRKVNYFSSMGAIVAAEVIILFFSTSWRLLFGKFELVRFLIVLALRITSICIMWYESTHYVYTTVERKRS